MKKKLKASSSPWRPGGPAAITTPEGERVCVSQSHFIPPPKSFYLISECKGSLNKRNPRYWKLSGDGSDADQSHSGIHGFQTYALRRKVSHSWTLRKNPISAACSWESIISVIT